MFFKSFLICGVLAMYVQCESGNTTMDSIDDHDDMKQYGPEHDRFLKNSPPNNNLPKTELALVSLMFRHGHRGPDMSEYDPKIATNNSAQSIGLGQLTKQGKLRLFQNGVMTRKMYDNFLGSVLEYGNVVVHPTHIPRTSTSALAYLAGLFPPMKEQQWTFPCKTSEFICLQAEKPEIANLWNPIPYEYNQTIIDEMIRSLNCPAFNDEMDFMEYLPEIQEMFDKYNALYEYITLNTDIQIKSKVKVFSIVSFLLANKNIGEELPPWTVPVWKEMLEVTDIVFQMMLYTDKQKQLAGGSISKRILNDMVAKAAGKLLPNNRKLIIYSGHDISVAPLYASLGGSDGFVDLKGKTAPVHYPVYGATIFIELHRILSTGKYVVKVRYHDFKSSEPKNLRLARCEEFCPLEDFIELTDSTTMSRDEQIIECFSA